jgi:hypothetical protein
MVVVTAKFLYECILNKFEWPLTLVMDQGVLFINDTISYLVNHFVFHHTMSTRYYTQNNGQVKSTIKVIGAMLTKLVNKKLNDYDEHLGVILFAYHIAFKVNMKHTPFQLFYGLHPFMPIFWESKSSTWFKI